MWKTAAEKYFDYKKIQPKFNSFALLLRFPSVFRGVTLRPYAGKTTSRHGVNQLLQPLLRNVQPFSLKSFEEIVSVGEVSCSDAVLELFPEMLDGI